MAPHVDILVNFSKKLHGLTSDELQNFDVVENRLDHLPHIEHDAPYFSSVEVAASLSQLYRYAQSFRRHVDWLRTANANISLSPQAAEGASTHLLQLSNLVNASLHQISEKAPQTPSPSLPAIATTFDVLQFSVEISGRLRVFCDWTKRVLRRLQRLSRCSRH